MLIQDGRITEAQLAECLARQAHDGGRLGTVMVEMGFIDLDTLTVYLGLELGIPIATRSTLDRAKRAAVRLLTPEQALLFRCIPVLVQDRQLVAAVDDPLDMAAMDQLSRLTGYRVLPRVAPELRIFYYLELYYGIPRPMRYASIRDDSMDTGMMRAELRGLPAPPLPGLPPRTDSPVQPPLPQFRPTVAGSAIPAAPLEFERSTAHQALESEADELVSALDSDQTASAKVVPLSEPDREAMSRAATLEIEPLEVYTPCTLEAALARIQAATQRGEVADAILSHAMSLFEVSVLCIVRDNMAFGWKAFGPDLDRDRVEALLIPLEASSLFQIAIHNNGLYHAVPLPGTLNSYLYRVLRCQAPTMATAVVISIGDRVVNVLYGHRSDQVVLQEHEQQGLQRIATATAEAYVRLIAASKKSSTSE